MQKQRANVDVREDMFKCFNYGLSFQKLESRFIVFVWSVFHNFYTQYGTDARLTVHYTTQKLGVSKLFYLFFLLSNDDYID